MYSPSQEGAYCIYCALFGVDSLGTLSCKPLTDMAHASTRLNDHFGRDEKSCKKSHTEARAKAQLFLDNIEQRTTDIQTFIDKAMNERIKANRTVLKSICKCVLLCGKQNLPIRGHRDDAKHISDRSFNSGNFQALIDFRVESGDSVLRDYLENAPKNCTYR